VVSRVGFLRSGLILAVLKAVGNRPEMRKVLVRVVRKGRMSLKMALWVEGEGVSAKPNVAKKLMNSGHWNWRASIPSKKLPRGPGGR